MLTTLRDHTGRGGDWFNFVQAGVKEIDLAACKVVISAGTVDIDYLVLALGR